MVQLGRVNFDRNPEEYLHLFTSDNTKLERRKFTPGLVDILTKADNGRGNGDVILAEKIIKVEHFGYHYNLLVARKGRFIDFDGKWILREDTEVQGVIFNGNERIGKYEAKDGIIFDVSIRDPIPNDNNFRKAIDEEVYLRGLASKEKGEKISYW